jgi:4-diphosphocytidyl-2-C-methyl-D-erythritol kinase
VTGAATPVGTRARLLAPAKINPRLEVLGRRPDGYHEVRTWMVALELADVLELRATHSGRVELRVFGEHASADVPTDGTNLAARACAAALEALRDACGVHADAGVEIALEKRVPSRAGLGAGSADAAAAFVGTESVFGKRLDPRLRRSALAALGSDCVFFVDAAATGVARCEGRGERVAPAPRIATGWWVALITPAVACSTASVYRALEKPVRRSREADRLPIDLFGTPAREARRWLHNDLEHAALEALPELRSWREAVDAGAGPGFRLSGSGSSFFGLFEDPRAAREALEGIAGEARARGLEARGHWLTRPSGWGIQFLSES